MVFPQGKMYKLRRMEKKSECLWRGGKDAKVMLVQKVVAGWI